MKYRSILLAAAASLITAVLVAQAQVPGVNSTLNSVFTLAYDNSTMKPTYSATQTGITAVASQTDQCTLTGSATKTIKVRRIWFSNLPTAAAVEPIAIVKRSTATTGTGGTLYTAAYDSSNPATTVGLAENWTAAPTVGTYVSTLADITFPFAISSGANAPALFEFGRLGQPIVLRGVLQQVAVNLNSTTFTGTVGCTFEWTEE
jgi:hypothetical protein